MKERKLSTVRKIAQEKFNIHPSRLQISEKKGKRFKIILDDREIHFGSYPYTGKGTFIDHHDENIKKAWQARHSKIMKNGKPAYLDVTSPEFYSWHLLW